MLVMNKQTEALKDLLEAVEHAIEIGDWKVDGRCDPDLAINRAKEALEQPPPKVEPFDVWAGTKPQEDVPIVFPRWDNGEPFEVRYPKQPAQEVGDAEIKQMLDDIDYYKNRLAKYEDVL